MLRLLSALLLISILSMYGLIAWELAWNMWPDDPKRCPIYRPLPNCEPPQPQPKPQPKEPQKNPSIENWPTTDPR